MMDLEKITGEVAELCSDVGGYIREQAELISHSDIEEKGKQNLVTYVDREAEKRLVQGLGNILPGSEFLAEEFDYQRTGNEYTWVVDPLDGTTNFVHGLPIYSVSVALMKDEQIISGVVFQVQARECFYAWQGSGAYLDGYPIHVSHRSELNKSLLVTGFPYRHEGKLDQYLAIFKELVENSRGVRRLGSAAVDLCYVAAGRLEGFYEYGLHPWDVAAGAIILEQAGGKVSDFKGGNHYLFGKQLIATNGSLHQQLLEIIARHFQ
jgi:myo-inositol-1(or 4)-monophosphatase